MAAKGNSPLERIRKIGQGTFGVVYYGRYCGNQEVAIKDIAGRMSNEAHQEANMLKQLQHPNIIRYIDVIIESHQTSLVMDFIDKDNLYHYIQQTVASSAYWRITQRILLDVARGMAYLHGRRIVHADLKGLNILLRHSYEAVICDFGLATVIADSRTQLTNEPRGTIRWFAPELCSIPPERSSFPSDIWAFGCVILEITSQTIPWIEQYPMKQEQILINALGQSKSASQFKKICREQPGPEKLVDLLCRCCSWDKSKRPRFDRIVDELSTLDGSSHVESHPTSLINSAEPKPKPKPNPNPNPNPKAKRSETPRGTLSLPLAETDLFSHGPFYVEEPTSLTDAMERMLLGDNAKKRQRRLEVALNELVNKDQRFYDPKNQRVVFRGPGGGYYYMNNNGKKSYLDKNKFDEKMLIPQ